MSECERLAIARAYLHGWLITPEIYLLQGQRAQRIEMLLLHEFYRRKFMIPDKLRSKDRERLTKAAARAQQMAEDGYIHLPEEDEKLGEPVMCLGARQECISQ